MNKKHRYKVGTDDSAKKDLEFSKVPNYSKMNNLLESLQYMYKGEINNEWQ